MAVDVAPSVAAAFEAAALQIGGRLVDEAVWHDDRCTWLGDDVGDEGEVVHRSLGPDLYGGTSGIGTMWQFDATHNNVLAGHPTLSNGHVTFTIPGTAAILITF